MYVLCWAACPISAQLLWLEGPHVPEAFDYKWSLRTYSEAVQLNNRLVMNINLAPLAVSIVHHMVSFYLFRVTFEQHEEQKSMTEKGV